MKLVSKDWEKVTKLNFRKDICVFYGLLKFVSKLFFVSKFIILTFIDKLFFILHILIDNNDFLLVLEVSVI